MADRKGCREQLQEKEDCVGKRCPSSRDNNRNANDNRNDDDDDGKNDNQAGSAEEEDVETQVENDPECNPTEWNEDEECSCDSGQGQRKLTREFKKNKKLCLKRYPTFELEKFESCETPDCDGSKGETTTQKVSFRLKKVSLSIFCFLLDRCQLSTKQMVKLEQMFIKMWSRSTNSS